MMVKGIVLDIITTRVVNGWNYGERVDLLVIPCTSSVTSFPLGPQLGGTERRVQQKLHRRIRRTDSCHRKVSGLRIFESRSFDGHRRVCRIVVGGT